MKNPNLLVFSAVVIFISPTFAEMPGKLPTKPPTNSIIPQPTTLVDNMKKACAPDITKFCKNAPPQKLWTCLNSNRDKLSQGCKAAVPNRPM